MKHVDIFTTPLCGYCHAAKRLLTEKGVKFTEYNVANDAALRAEMLKRAPGSRTVPPSFVGATHVGGCDQLYALAGAGTLDALLAG